ncbi:MAG: hypothetical protein AOA66_0716 [Candidatus Bathyarchaeota archaeon BA2]|nr:MAG: hypothetical protein AOA66_0716 [Candidatus Bathyarchaeota archaeon BA2]
MAKKPTKDDALEALDFIVNVLKEHEKDLDRLIGQLATVTESLGETGEVATKIEKVEERLSTIQSEVASLIKYLSTPKEMPAYPIGPPVIVKCKKWEDFKILAVGADTVSYQFKETEKTFQVDALKEGRVLIYTGEFPQNASLLKIWLSKELGVTEEKIFEGVLAIR